MTPRETVAWAARLTGVREVSLEGSAELRWWKRRLAPAGVQPAEKDGRARLLILGAAARFAGLPFHELSVSVLLADSGAAFLLQAFNSVRFFAWSERTFFSTPYLHERVRVELDPFAEIAVGLGGAESLRAAMRGDAPVPVGISGWEGRVLLPPPDRSPRRCFFARIRGATESRPFASGDLFTVRSIPGVTLFDDLIESDFKPDQWLVRRNAVHMKSKTYER